VSGKRALITGISGQDGSYLAELLLKRGNEVHGIVPAGKAAWGESALPAEIQSQVVLHPALIEDETGVRQVLEATRPDECYHLAAQSFAGADSARERETLSTNIAGTHNILAALVQSAPGCRLFFAGSSEQFGDAEESPQSERTPFRPVSVYGISKAAGYEMVRYYRARRGLHASCGLLFNHESPRRGAAFVTRKISLGVARIAAGKAHELTLGGLDARRDWGWAPEYVEAMWRMLQQTQPDDYVIATGETHSIRELAEQAFCAAGLDFQKYVRIDQSLTRPPERVERVGGPGKAWSQLGWRARKPFSEIVREMVAADCAAEGVEAIAKLREG
jgi:GDPmannose 4,6-dehydratase